MKKVILLLLACVVALSLSAFAGDKSKKKDNAKDVAGWVSDEKCGAEGAKAEAANCTKKCIEGGSKIVFVTDKDKKVLHVSNPETLKGHEGHHVNVNGHVDEAAGSIHVMSVSMIEG